MEVALGSVQWSSQVSMSHVGAKGIWERTALPVALACTLKASGIPVDDFTHDTGISFLIKIWMIVAIMKCNTFFTIYIYTKLFDFDTK